MKNTSPEVDQYIERAAEFARPILKRIRKAFHAAHPDVTEVIKWGAPFFEYKGVLGNMAAFKQHVGWGFWKANLMPDPHGILKPDGEHTAMGGARLTTVKDLPPDDVLVAYVREAIRLNEEGVKVARPKKAPQAEVAVPEELAAALAARPAARKAFDAFPPSHRREYIAWITEAKQAATRAKRVAQAVEWMAEGKSRNWKYERK
jgi:uncharacterized protein YdeI (YjbR/CyaY-like superfamily)